ncbi:MAG: serine/threonine-protein kinase, partial [Limnospira maxima]
MTEGPTPDKHIPPGEKASAEEIAIEAATRDPAEREAFVAEACGDDPELRARVQQHLERFESHDRWLEEIVTRGTVAVETEPPDVVGPYRVREVLGQGGMGTVYLAEREDRDFRMPVALKVLHPALSTPVFRQRFLSERRILARLSHPGIARLIDGGILPNGTHYLAMEYVEGEDLLTWAEGRALGLRERVELLLQVCRALAYAHRNLVVHRDLKPSNTRVTPEGEVKLLDFGIARVLDLTEEEEGVTQAHPHAARPMTPAFASPEQRRGEAIGTPSDVYSLGVLLEKLLRGTAAAPGGRPGVLPRTLPSDLRAIHEKATRAEPEARYGSAEEMGADLRRWLEGRPVEARAGSTRYRLGRFLGRHRWAASLAALALLGLVGVAG